MVFGSASNNPTWCGAWYYGGVQWDCWQESYDKTSNFGYQGYNIIYVWNKSTNYWSMYNQFMCHADWVGPFKPGWVWNIEPSKADKGYWGFANFWDKCN